MLGLGRWPGTVAAVAIALTITFALAELVYRGVEKPAIRYGKRIGREPGPASQGW